MRGYISLGEVETCASEKKGKPTSKRKTKRRLDTPFDKNGINLFDLRINITFRISDV